MFPGPKPTFHGINRMPHQILLLKTNTKNVERREPVRGTAF